MRELTELANVSRGTFYFHYTDIYDLMDHVEREQIHTLELLMDDFPHRFLHQQRDQCIGQALAGQPHAAVLLTLAAKR